VLTAEALLERRKGGDDAGTTLSETTAPKKWISKPVYTKLQHTFFN